MAGYFRGKGLVIFTLLISLVLIPLLAGNVMAADQENCLMCHSYSGIGRYTKKGVRKVYYINEKVFRSTVHGSLRCRGCHRSIDAVPHREYTKVDCTVNCHLKEPSTGKEFSHKGIKRIYDASAHSPYRPDGRLKANSELLPTCKYCHENPKYIPDIAQEELGTFRPDLVINVCAQCHENKQWRERFFGHMSRRIMPRRSRADMIDLCLSCHQDAARMSKFNVAPIMAFQDSFHFQGIKFGQRNLPDCLSCHAPPGFAAHSIFPKEDERSAVNPKNKFRYTCGRAECHAKADESFAAGSVHEMRASMMLDMGESQRDEIVNVLAKAATGEKAAAGLRQVSYKDEPGARFKIFILNVVAIAYKLIIGMVLGWMLLHQTLDLIQTIREKITAKAEGHDEHHDEDLYFERLNFNERIQHFFLATAVIMLVITGVMAKIPAESLAGIGILENAGHAIFIWRGIIHRIFGVLLLATSFYHIYYIFFVEAGKRWVREMIPTWKDLTDMGHNHAFLFGFAKERPKFERFNYAEKLEYWTLIIGNTIIGGTGVILWGESSWSKFVVDLSFLLHNMEAIMAIGAISIWHFYTIHFKPGMFPMSWTWIDGKLSAHHMKEEHGALYERLMAERHGHGGGHHGEEK